MSNLAALKAELVGDPLGRDYASMTDTQAADSLNTVDRERNRTSMSGDEVFNATDASEFQALDALAGDKKAYWLSFCARAEIDPFGAANVALVQWVFGVGSTTITNLQALRKENVSRAEELSLGRVRAGDVARARAA